MFKNLKFLLFFFLISNIPFMQAIPGTDTPVYSAKSRETMQKPVAPEEPYCLKQLAMRSGEKTKDLGDEIIPIKATIDQYFKELAEYHRNLAAWLEQNRVIMATLIPNGSKSFSENHITQE